jgi:hypothetical protein
VYIYYSIYVLLVEGTQLKMKVLGLENKEVQAFIQKEDKKVKA